MGQSLLNVSLHESQFTPLVDVVGQKPKEKLRTFESYVIDIKKVTGSQTLMLKFSGTGENIDNESTLLDLSQSLILLLKERNTGYTTRKCEGV